MELGLWSHFLASYTCQFTTFTATTLNNKIIGLLIHNKIIKFDGTQIVSDRLALQSHDSLLS